MSDARRLAADLNKKAIADYALIAATVKKGAQNLKDHYREDAESSGYYKRFARSISYDVGLTGLRAEVGPDKKKKGAQGGLGNLLYFGSSNNAPVLDFDGPVLAEEPKFHAALEAILGDL